jgi:hypothetical protein
MFETNPNKDIIRRTFDKPLVKRDFEQKRRALVYFGLPSGGMYDVIDWKEFLGVIIAVERDPDEKRSMMRKAFSQKLLNRIQVLDGDVEDVLITGKDNSGEKPQIDKFDIVNLDYLGGLVVKDLKGNSRRVSAIRSLFARQSNAECDFRLFLTINVRNRDEGELDENVRTIEQRVTGFGWDASKTRDWYLARGVAQKMKLFVPSLFSNLAIGQRLSLSSYDAVAYASGERSNMLHFALKFVFAKQLQGTQIDELRLLMSPLSTVSRGKILPLPEFPPAPRRTSGQS